MKQENELKLKAEEVLQPVKPLPDQAEVALREEKYRTLFESIDEGFCIIELIPDEHGRITDLIWREANDAFERHTGMRGFLGKRASEVLPGLETLWLDLMTRVYLTGEPVRTEDYSVDLQRWLNVRYSRVGGAGSRFLAAVFDDITERKQREHRQTFQLQLSDTLRPLRDAGSVKAAATELLGRALGASRVFYAEVRGDDWIVEKGYTRGVPVLPDGAYPASTYGPWIMATYRAGEQIIFRNTGTDERFSPAEQKAHAAIGILGAVGVPLVKNGELVAILAVHTDQPRDWTAAEIGQVAEAAERTWAAVERASAEQALRVSEEKYRTLFESMDEGVVTLEVLFDGQGQAVDFLYLDSNPAQRRQSKMAVDIVGRRASELYPDMGRVWFDRFGRVARTGEPERFEEQGVSGDWFDAYVSRVGGPSSHKLVCVYNNITERKRLEKARADRETQLQALLDVTPQAVFLLDADFHIRFINVRARPFFQLDDPVGQDFRGYLRTVLPEQEAESILGIFQRTLETGEPFAENEREVLLADGPHFYEVSFHRIELPDHSYGVVCYFNEVTAQMKARQSISESEAKYRMLFDSVEEGFCLLRVVYDDQGQPVDLLYAEANPAFLVQMGLSQPVGKTVLNLVPDLDPFWIQAIANVVSTGESLRVENHTPATDRWFDVLASRVDKREHHLVAVVCIDITERKQREANLLLLAEVQSGFPASGGWQDFIPRIGDRIREHFRFALLKLIEFDPDSDDVFALYDTAGPVSEAGAMVPCRLHEYFAPEHIGRLATGEVVAIDNVETEMEGGGAAFAEYGPSSILIAPYLANDRLRFLIGGVRGERSQWRDDECDLLRELAAQIYLRVERARAEDAMRRSEERLRIAVDSAELGTWDWNVTEDRLVWNDWHYRLLGLVPENKELSADLFWDRVHPEDLEPLMAAVKSASDNGSDYHSEFRIIRADNGELRWISSFARAFRSGQMARMAGVIYDCTDRRLAADKLQLANDQLEAHVKERTRELADAVSQLRDEGAVRAEVEKERMELLKRVINTQEDERARISRDLHDNLGQHMVAMMLGLESLQKQSGQTEDPSVAKALAELRTMVDKFNTAVRRQAWQLRPAELDLLGLEAAVQHYIHDWSERTGIPVEFEIVYESSTDLPAEAVTAFYRVIQESLTNVHRHAAASAVRITYCPGKKAWLCIEDNGKGFNIGNVRGRLGLLGMQERLVILGGSLKIESRPGKGTQITAALAGAEPEPRAKPKRKGRTKR